MIKLQLLILGLLLTPNSFASDGHEGAPLAKYQTVLAQRPAKESVIPKEVIEKVKAVLAVPDELKGGTKKKLGFMSAEVFFFEEHKSLFESPFHVITPMGGGTVDMGRILPVGRAKFRLRVALKAADKTEAFATKVFFIPKIEKKSASKGDEKQCGKFFDMTSFYLKRLSSEDGFETYVTDGIYAFNLIGTFVFVREEDHQVLLANVNFLDSRYDSFACPVIAEAGNPSSADL